MLEVTDMKYIRKEMNEKGYSYSDVTRMTNTDVRTVKKYADEETLYNGRFIENLEND